MEKFDLKQITENKPLLYTIIICVGLAVVMFIIMIATVAHVNSTGAKNPDGQMKVGSPQTTLLGELSCLCDCTRRGQWKLVLQNTVYSLFFYCFSIVIYRLQSISVAVVKYYHSSFSEFCETFY